jgi:hypothetical protein
VLATPKPGEGGSAAVVAMLFLSSRRGSFRNHPSSLYLERGSSDHLASSTGKSCVRAMATSRSSPISSEMKMNTSASTSGEIRPYTNLQQQIHDALRVQHPEWVEPNGDCPTCESYESRLAELLRLSSPSEHRSAA